MTREYPGDSVVYREEQRFRQIWILILIGFIALLSWYSFLLQIVIGEPFGTNPAPDILVLILLVIFGIIFPVWFFVMRLEVQVTRTDLRFRLFPLHLQWREFPLATIVEAEAVTYRPLLEYGGWGIRIGRKGMAYNVSGNRGVQVSNKPNIFHSHRRCYQGNRYWENHRAGDIFYRFREYILPHTKDTVH